jgi:hypothetical protein
METNLAVQRFAQQNAAKHTTIDVKCHGNLMSEGNHRVSVTFETHEPDGIIRQRLKYEFRKEDLRFGRVLIFIRKKG